MPGRETKHTAMKNVIALFIVLALCLTNAPLSGALVPDNLNASSSKITSDGINNVAEDQAEMFKSLGLFLGTDQGFELYRRMTRAEAGTLIVRFMGEEKNALAQNNRHPFRDVPSWADPYIGWLYKNNITKGVSATRYGSAEDVTYWQFATLLARTSAGYDDFISAGVGTDEEYRYIDRLDQDPPGSDFFRADAVSMLTRFMRILYLKDTSELKTVAQFLIDKGSFIVEQFVAAGTKVYPVFYTRTEDGRMVAQLEGVTFQTGELTGIAGDDSYPPRDIPYFYAWKDEGDNTVLYRIDSLTLEESEAARWTKKQMPLPYEVRYLDTFAGKDYLALRGTEGVALVSTDGSKADIIAKGEDFTIRGLTPFEPYLRSWLDGNFLVTAIDDSVFVLSENRTVRHRLSSGTSLIGIEGNLAVLYGERSGTATIQGVRLKDWTVTDTYRIPRPDAKDDPSAGLPLIRQYHSSPYEWSGAGIYGEAGLFTVRDGRLDRVTDRPVLDVTGLRVGAGGAHAVLTYNPEEGRIGTAIYQYNGPMLTGNLGYEEIERLSNDPPHGINISRIHGLDSMVSFESRTGVGMESYDVYTYYPYYVADEDRTIIYVMSFTAGRPEISFTEHDAHWYVQQEQERLNALGFGYER